MLRRNKFLLTMALIVVIAIAVRAALPYVVKDYVNRGLHGLEAYDGSVEDIDLALWRGAYSIDGIRIVKRGREQNTPFFEGDRMDLSVQWRSLLKGSLVSEVLLVRPVINLVQEESAQDSQLGTEEDWRARLEQLFPFRFNTIEARDATITFRAPGIRSQDALKAERVHARVTNLTNVADEHAETFAHFGAEGTILDDAPATVRGSLDPWASAPTFDVNLEVKAVALPKINPWLRQYIKADAESGEFELYLEIAAADDKFKGYAKPILKNVNITSRAEKEENLLRKLWEGIVDFAANVLENDDENQVAARIPFSGTIEKPKAGLIAAIMSVLRNAFVSAFARSLEGSISLRDVKQNLNQLSADDDDAQDRDGKNNNENTTDSAKPRKRVGPRE
jgi:hypothetical protein